MIVVRKIGSGTATEMEDEDCIGSTWSVVVVASSDGDGKTVDAESDESEMITGVDGIGVAYSFMDHWIKW